MIAVPCCESIGMAVSLTVMLCDGLQIAQLRMNVDSMDQSHRETKVKYETDLANLREQVAVQHNSHNRATIFLTCLGQLVFFVDTQWSFWLVFTGMPAQHIYP